MEGHRTRKLWKGENECREMKCDSEQIKKGRKGAQTSRESNGIQNRLRGEEKIKKKWGEKRPIHRLP